MTEVYNVRIGDLLYRVESGKPIMAIVYKLTPKYVYYAVCAQSQYGNGPAYITTDHKISKSSLYDALKKEKFNVSYVKSNYPRKKIENI